MATISITPSSPIPPSPTSKVPSTRPPPSPTSPEKFNQTKRLRSCLSPTRRFSPDVSPLTSYDMASGSRSTSIALSITSTMSTDEPSLTTCSSSPMTSRSTSFSSQDGDSSGWRRCSKNVRWDESGGCVNIATYSTWSADDYDRSPLDPPKPEERACTMPERGSRCFSPLNCFTEEKVNPRDLLSETLNPIIRVPSPILFPAFDIFMDPHSMSDSEDEYVEDINEHHQQREHDHQEQEMEEENGEEEGEEESEEDKEWEECMERRRLMFAQMCQRPQPMMCGSEDVEEGMEGEQEGEEERGRPRVFEGYTSLSAQLVALLSESSGVNENKRDVFTPIGTPIEGEIKACVVAGPSRPRMNRILGGHPLRQNIIDDNDNDEDDEEEEEEEEELEEDEEAEEVEEVEEEEGEEAGNEGSSAEVVFKALRAFKMIPSDKLELKSGDEERDRSQL